MSATLTLSFLVLGALGAADADTKTQNTVVLSEGGGIAVFGKGSGPQVTASALWRHGVGQLGLVAGMAALDGDLDSGTFVRVGAAGGFGIPFGTQLEVQVLAELGLSYVSSAHNSLRGGAAGPVLVLMPVKAYESDALPYAGTRLGLRWASRGPRAGFTAGIWGMLQQHLATSALDDVVGETTLGATAQLGVQF